MAVHRNGKRSRFWDRLLLPPRKPRSMGLVAAQMSINPFEMYWLIAICLIGAAFVLGVPLSSSVRQLLPYWAVWLWSANLAVGGLLALVGGLAYKRLERGLTVYQFGWGLVGVGCLVYGMALLLRFKFQAAYPAFSNLLWALACFTRVLQVQRFFLVSRRRVLASTKVQSGEEEEA